MHGIQYSTEELESLGGAPKAAATSAFDALKDEPEVIEDLGEAQVIPDDVIGTIERAIDAGTLPDYLAYAVENAAPQHIVNHIEAVIKEQSA